MGRSTTFVFADGDVLRSAVDILLRSGICSDRISIHQWERGIGVRVFADLEDTDRSALADLGARSFSVFEDEAVSPTVPIDIDTRDTRDVRPSGAPPPPPHGLAQFLRSGPGQRRSRPANQTRPAKPAAGPTLPPTTPE